MTRVRQCVLIVLDSVGIGALPDAADFGDAGSDTLGHIAETVGLSLPNLTQLGLGRIARDGARLAGLAAPGPAVGAYGRLVERSAGKDSTTGHWEMMGLTLERPFKTYPDGFPDDLIDAFIEAAGIEGVLGNLAISGTVVIEQLGREHVATGKPIVYTSADPVFQIAAHEEVIPIERLYELCQAAFELVPRWGLSRVIARPFVGEWPSYERTYRRKDFTFPPVRPTALDGLNAAARRVVSVGKVDQLFAGRGIDRAFKARDNAHGIELTLDCMKDRSEDFVFVNLVDFDSKYGHRRDPKGYAAALEAFDAAVPALRDAMEAGDLLMITADHGNDPTFRGTDHTREYVPVLATGAWVQPVDLGTRSTFADLGATVAEFLGHPEACVEGTSFLADLRGEADAAL